MKIFVAIFYTYYSNHFKASVKILQKFSNLTVKNLSFPCQAAKRTQTKNSKMTAVDFLCRALWDYCAAATLLHTDSNTVENMS